jgi:hypothetical protein
MDSYIKSKLKFTAMEKNRGEIFESIEVDPISGQYFITIPEQIMNQLEWYEDTRIKFTMDGSEVILSEAD